MLLSLVACHPAFVSAETTCAAPALTELETANLAFEKAHESGDVARLDALLAEDFVLYHSGGLQSEIESRAAFLKRLSAMPRGLFLSRELKETDSRIYGPVGLVAGRIVTRSKSQWTRGRVKESSYHYLRVFRTENCRWRISAWHSGWAAADRRDVQFIDGYLAVYPPETNPAEDKTTLGARTFDEACASCHRGAGAFGAPGVDDAAYWRRRAASMEQVYSNALNGMVASRAVMPAKGGRPDLSDEAVRAAVDYMVLRSRSPGTGVNR